jgi:hypothetical protein
MNGWGALEGKHMVLRDSTAPTSPSEGNTGDVLMGSAPVSPAWL